MFQRDYILRLVEQLAKTLGALLVLKKAKRFDEAELTVSEAARNLVGLDVPTLHALPLDQIVTLFSPGGSLDAGKCLVVAELLEEDAEVKGLKGDEAGAYRSRIRALGLLLEVSGREGLDRMPEPARYRAKIEGLTEALRENAPVPAIQKRLVLHYEREGAFGRAEDVLFELIDTIGGGDVETVAFGIALYERLLSKNDEELERGGLPRDEVQEGLGELREGAGA